jgi:XRE family transcriptional regulator, regulator of sulfur utilization
VKNQLVKVFGQIIKEQRKLKGLTQQQVADYTGLDRAFISELERGKLLPSLETFFKLAPVLKIKPVEFIEKIEKAMRKG